MENVIQFPWAHAQALGDSRAANAISLSEVSPPDLATSVSSMAAHRSAGMLSRCRHLEIVGTRAHTSEAIASLEGHKSITSRNDRKSAMRAVLGQIVLKSKDKLALDGKISLGHTVRMADSEEDQFKQAFIERVKAARIATGKKQWQVAELLNVPQDHYKHWEKTRLMPHHLIGRFCIICSVDPEWLMTGRGQKPLKPPHLVEAEPEPVHRPKRARRPKAA